jgi:hypothetical protein
LPVGDDRKFSSLIQQLDSDDWHAREAAQRQLLDIGQPVRSDEQRSRAEAILYQLDQRRPDVPTLITLHQRNANPRDVFAQIADQAKVPIRIWPDTLWAPRWLHQSPAAAAVTAAKRPAAARLPAAPTRPATAFTPISSAVCAAASQPV